VSASRLLALFTIGFVTGIALAAGAAHVIAIYSVPERTHIYWCRIPVLIVSAEGIEESVAAGPCGRLRITKSV
jgi:hypothetical protein